MEAKQKKDFVRLLRRMKKTTRKDNKMSDEAKRKNIELIQAIEDAVLKIKPY